MLVLSRKIGEPIVIDGRIVVTLVAVQGGKARIGISAPEDVEIHRMEVFQQVHPEAAADLARAMQQELARR